MAQAGPNLNRNRFSAVATISVPTLGIKGKRITKEERYLETIDPAPATPAGEPLGEIEVEVSEEVAKRLKLGWSIEVAKTDTDTDTPHNEAQPLLLETTHPTSLPIVAPPPSRPQLTEKTPPPRPAFTPFQRAKFFVRPEALHEEASLPIELVKEGVLDERRATRCTQDTFTRNHLPQLSSLCS